MDAVFDSGGLTAWAGRRPPTQLLALLEVLAASGGVAIVPTVAVVESTTGRPVHDAAVNRRLRRALLDPCALERARRAAALRFRCTRNVSAADAVVAATAVDRPRAAVVTSDPEDLRALLVAADSDQRLIGV